MDVRGLKGLEDLVAGSWQSDRGGVLRCRDYGRRMPSTRLAALDPWKCGRDHGPESVKWKPNTWEEGKNCRKLEGVTRNVLSKKEILCCVKGFRLRRRKRLGRSVRKPFHEPMFFLRDTQNPIPFLPDPLCSPLRVWGNNKEGVG